MKFGLPSYLNVLPLALFVKKSRLSAAQKAAISKAAKVPSALNKALLKGKLNGALSSSIASAAPRYKRLNLGICAYKKVNSVLVKKNSSAKADSASASSNALASVLGFKAEVLIGDRALKALFDEPDNYIDLASTWYKSTHLPFTFGHFACHKNSLAKYQRFFAPFLKESNTASKRLKIPFILAQKEAEKRGISLQFLRQYLSLIYYEMGVKENKARLSFLRKARSLRFAN